MKGLFAKYPSPFKFWLGPDLFIMTDDPDDIQILLNAPNSSYKDEVYKFIEEPFNGLPAGLITANGDAWRHHRKLLNPCFTMNILDTYVPIFNRCARNMSDNVAKHATSGKVFDIAKNIHACSLDMIVGMDISKVLKKCGLIFFLSFQKLHWVVSLIVNLTMM
jgi:cytochrome P450